MNGACSLGDRLAESSLVDSLGHNCFSFRSDMLLGPALASEALSAWSAVTASSLIYTLPLTFSSCH